VDCPLLRHALRASGKGSALVSVEGIWGPSSRRDALASSIQPQERKREGMVRLCSGGRGEKGRKCRQFLRLLRPGKRDRKGFRAHHHRSGREKGRSAFSDDTPPSLPTEQGKESGQSLSVWGMGKERRRTSADGPDVCSYLVRQGEQVEEQRRTSPRSRPGGRREKKEEAGITAAPAS